MDKDKETQYQQQIATLEREKKEFSDAKVAAEQVASEAADKQLKAEIHSFCEENKLNTNKYKEMNIEAVLFASAKANQTIEFASKDKDGKEVKEQKPLLEVLKNTIKSFQIATPKEGEMQEFSQKLPGEDKKGKVELADQYVNDHPAEFADVKEHVQKVAKALKMESNKQINFKSK